jgi:hypothetical protein
MTIRNSTFSGNTAGNTGGGIFNYGTLTLTNSTLSSNSAGWAGGIWQSGNMAKLSFVTVAENSGKGIVVNSGSSTLQIRHSIVAKNTGGNCDIVVGTFIPSGNNFDDDNTCTGFAALTPSTLGPLAGNGGATQTHALFPGSQAINAASDCQDLEGNTVHSDQRGVSRPQPSGGNCDAGAYERDDTTPPTVLAITRADPNPTSAASVAFSVTFSEVVTGVDAGDFTLVTTGSIGGASVTGVSGTGSVYTVTVNTGTGSGTLRLDVPATATITDLAGNGLSGLPYTGGEVYNKLTSLFLPLVHK